MTALDQHFQDRLAVWSDIQGHLQFMHDLVVAENAQTVVELGVRDGVSTSALLAAVEKTDGDLWSVDTNPSPPQPWDGTELWTFIIGDDLNVDKDFWLPKHIDVCFIDTNHWYHHTLAELRIYEPRSKILLLHDTELEWPWMAPDGDPPFPVRRAIERYMEDCPDLTVEWREGSYGMAVIR